MEEENRPWSLAIVFWERIFSPDQEAKGLQDLIAQKVTQPLNNGQLRHSKFQPMHINMHWGQNNGGLTSVRYVAGARNVYLMF